MKPFDNLVSCLHKGEISRRDFMQKAAALGLAAAVPGALITATLISCGIQCTAS